ncbi:uncharacterized protein LOC143264189 [Megachile rotundata]|uniref:uncharacterized protein LOC143264189 n=1 Tax=Megachile rotundata TaxID=143995 RepID=UPI003FD5CE8B
MDAVTLQERYLKVTKRYMIWFGIWPYQRKSTQYIARFIVYVIMVPGALGQIARMVCFFSWSTVLQQLSLTLAMLLLLVKQGNYIVNNAKFVAHLNSMFDDWEKDKTKEEIAIMVSYMDRGAFFTSIYLVTSHICATLFLQMPWWPRIADILMPLNESRPRGYIFHVYYFVNDDDYYYWIIAHTAIITIGVMYGFIACDIYFVFAVQHACGLFAVTGHRFKKSVDNICDQKKVAEMSHEIYKKICHSIRAHDRAIRFVREFDDFHYGYLLICMGMIVAAFSVTLLWISRLPISSQFCQYCMFLTVQLMHIFFLTFQGQFVINSMDEVYNDIYEGLWYNTMPKVQELFILALRSATDTPQITAGGRIPMNLQTFADVIKASVSYFTVFQSM